MIRRAFIGIATAIALTVGAVGATSTPADAKVVFKVEVGKHHKVCHKEWHKVVYWKQHKRHVKWEKVRVCHWKKW